MAAGPPVLEEPRFTFVRPEGETEEATAGARAGKGKGGSAVAASGKAASPKPFGAPGLGGPSKSGRLKPGEPADKEGAPVDQAEIIKVGKERQPGRIFRIRGINRS